MTRSYVRVLPDLYRRKALGLCECDAGDCHHVPYPPEALGAFLGVLCLAETQIPRGRFANRKALEGHLEGNGVGAAYADQVGFLLSQGDLVVQPDGSLYVEGWDELQEGNWQVAERMRRYRNRKNPQPDPVDVSDEDDPAVAYRDVVGRFPSGKTLEWIDDLVRQFGPDRVRAEIGRQSMTGTKDLLSRVSDALRIEERKAAAREKREEEAKVKAGREARTSATLLTSRHYAGQHEEQPDADCPECKRRAAA